MGHETTALDIVTVVVAGYAALVGTFALAFQIISWARSWSTRVEVKLGPFELVSANADPVPVILFRMINHSSHPVKITHLGFAPQKRGGQGSVIIRPLPVEVELPVAIEPRDSQSLWTTRDHFPHWLDRDKKVRALITTSDGKEFKSKPVSARTLAEGEA